ncbi:MAG: hypothetical protein PW734_10345 [Verrucomicrobium sp.]|nr:hypothetical protein [Verrucomicrobium sp.]
MTPPAGRLALAIFLVADGMFFAGFLAASLVLPSGEAFRKPVALLYWAHLAFGIGWAAWALLRRRPLVLPLFYFRYLFGLGILLFLLLYARLWF